jgi:4-hydroxy-tetrahydrodipicolinate synthase
MLTEQQVKGIYIPVVTPFDAAGEIDLESYDKYIKEISKKSIQAVVVNGTTGESPTVTLDEVKTLVTATRKILNKSRLPLVVGTGTNDTRSTIMRTELVGNLGADASLVVVPYYNKPSQEGIIEHFRAVAQVGLPIIVYNIPSRTGVGLSVQTTRTILDMDNIIGLKECSGGTQLMSELSRYGSKPVLCGEDVFFYDMLCCGAAGGMLASANINTDRFIKVYEAFTSGQIGLAKQSFDALLPFIQLVFREANPAPIKWILQQMGDISSDTLRLPMTSISQSLQQELRDYLA